MPEFMYNNKKVYYDIYGKGTPLVMMNGIMMSHLSWQPFIASLKNRQLILFDFFDQGKSEKMDNESYKHDIQVELVKALFDHLSIKKADIVGISYGAQIALQFAIHYQDYVNKLMVFNCSSATSSWLHDIGRAWVDAAKTYDPMTFYHVAIPYIYSPYFYNKNIDWMNARKGILGKIFNKPFLDSMIRLIESSEGYDIKTELNKIVVPTFVIAADCDYITPLFEAEYVHQCIKDSEFIILNKCGHASMYEKPQEFVALINGFLEMDGIKIV